MALDDTQFNKLRAKLTTQKQLEGSVVKSNIEPGATSRVADAFKARTDAGAEAINSNQNIFSKALQTVGEGAGFVGDLGFEAIKAITPQPVEDAVKSGVEAVANTAPVKSAVLAYTTWATQHPEAARNLQSVINIGSILPSVKGAKLGVDAIESGSKKVLESGIDAGKSVANKVGDAMTPIESGVESVLNPSKLIPKERLIDIPMEKISANAEIKSAKLDRYSKQAEKAVNDFSQPTPLALAGDKAEEALVILNNKLNKQGQLKQVALEQVGDIIVPDIGTYREKLAQTLSERVGLNIDRVTGQLIPAKGRASKIALDAADNKMIQDVYGSLRSLGKNPTIRQVDDTIDAIQDVLYKRKASLAIPVNSQVEGVLKSVVGDLNKKVKSLGGEQYRKANDKFAYFIDSRDKLNKALGTDGVKGASLMKRLFSPAGEDSRRLFKEIKDLTGIDLVEEATLAKFVMENIGDARQASLLEEVIKVGSVNPKTFIGTAAQNVINKIQDPIEKARRIIKSSVK
jgi:hypothetical protein